MSWFHHLFLPRESNNQRAKLLHPSSILILIVLFFGFQLTLSKVSIHLPQILGFSSQIPPEEIIRLTNIERVSHGLSPVNPDSELSQAALQKAGDMFARDYWAHVSPNGTQPWFFITQSGYSYRFAGENLARDFSDSGSVVSAWMASTTHRENLLNNRYQDIGVAVVDGQLDGRETTLVVQFFATRLSAAPQVSDTSSFVVQAAEVATPSPQSLTNPFSITKIISIILLGVIASVLIIDIILVHQKKIVRWTSKSFAHLLFIAVLIIAALVILRGQIL